MYTHKSFIKKTKTKNMTCDHELCTDHISYPVKKINEKNFVFARSNFDMVHVEGLDSILK